MRRIVWTTRPAPGQPAEQHEVEMSDEELQLLGKLARRYRDLPPGLERVAAWNEAHAFMEAKIHLDATLVAGRSIGEDVNPQDRSEPEWNPSASESEASSQGSEGSTSASSGPDTPSSSSARSTSGDAGSSPPASPESPATPTYEMSDAPQEPQTFDWQLDGTKDQSWGGKARAWIEDTPGRARALTRNKTLAVWIPPVEEDPEAAEEPPLMVEAFNLKEDSTPSEISPTLGSDKGGWGEMAAVWSITERTREGGRNLEMQPDEAYALDNPGAGGRSQTRMILTQEESLTPWDPQRQRIHSGEAHPTLQGGASGERGNNQPMVLTSSAEGSPAKTSRSPDDAPASSTDPAATSSSSSPGLPMTLFGPEDMSSLRTYPDFFPATVDEISPSYSRRWPSSGFTTSHGESWTADTSECPNEGGAYSSLPDVLEGTVAPKYFLSPKAAVGILRRAERRGRELPAHLLAALEAVAGPATTGPDKEPTSSASQDSGAEDPTTTTDKPTV